MSLNDVALVFDIGSGSCKVGFAGDDAPKALFPTIVANRKTNIEGIRKNYFGDETKNKADVSNIHYPITHGIVSNWLDLEEILQYAFSDRLNVNSENYPVFLTEAPLNPKQNRFNWAEIMFEKFSSPAIYFSNTGFLSLFSSGRTTGTVVESGDGVTHAISIYDGYEIKDSILRYDFGGRDITNYLSELLNDKGYNFNTTTEKQIVKDIKEKICYVSQNFEEEIASTELSSNDAENSFILPDGESIKVNKEKIMCTEALFRPSLICLSAPGIHQLVCNSISKSDLDVRADLYRNIVLAGGSTLVHGFKERLENELALLAPNNLQTKVVASPERELSVWVGGSILASLSTFKSSWITKEYYFENGSRL